MISFHASPPFFDGRACSCLLLAALLSGKQMPQDHGLMVGINPKP